MERLPLNTPQEQPSAESLLTAGELVETILFPDRPGESPLLRPNISTRYNSLIEDNIKEMEQRTFLMLQGILIEFKTLKDNPNTTWQEKLDFTNSIRQKLASFRKKTDWLTLDFKNTTDRAEKQYIESLYIFLSNILEKILFTSLCNWNKNNEYSNYVVNHLTLSGKSTTHDFDYQLGNILQDLSPMNYDKRYLFFISNSIAYLSPQLHKELIDQGYFSSNLMSEVL